MNLNKLMNYDLDVPSDVSIPDRFEVSYLEMSDGVKLRYIYFHPENPRGHLFLYPGMNTIVMSWVVILEKIANLNYQVDYIESREKYTAVLDKKIHKITRERMTLDMEESISLLGLVGKDYIALGSSLGSDTMIINLAKKKILPKFAILVGPNKVHTVPLLFRLILPFVNDWIYQKIGLKIIKRIILKRYTDKNKDPNQYIKYRIALELANIYRLKTAVKVWVGNSLVEYLPLIDGKETKCYFIGATHDKLHPGETTVEMKNMIPNAQYIDLKTNSAAHDQPLIDFIVNEIEKQYT